MNKVFIKLLDFFGLLDGVRRVFKGKKTILSAIMGILVSLSTIIPPMILWTEKTITTSQLIEQIQMPAGAFWVSITFLFSAFHTTNVIEEKEGK